MRGLAIAGMFTTALIGCPAFAQETGLYVGGHLGAVVSAETDQDYTPGAGAGTTGNISTDHELGVDGSAFVGYDFGAFRVEAEAGYMSAGIEGFTSNFLTPGPTAAGSHSASGDVKARRVMVNAMFDVGGFNDFAFFIGGGAGVAKFEVSGMASSGSSAALDDEDSDWRFAWQGIAGVRKPLTSNIDAHVRYRYFNVSDAEMTGFGGRAVTTELTTHSVEAGITFNF